MPDHSKKRPVEPVPLKNVLTRVLASCRRNPDMELARVWDHWDAVVGRVVAENAQPAAFKGRRLIVHVTGSVWVHQLQFMKEGILQKLNEALGKPLLEEIRFKIGPLR